MKKTITRILSGICSTALLLCGCAKNEVIDLTENAKKDITVCYDSPLGEKASTVADFSLTLLKKLYDSEKNVLISPLSVTEALAMCANGADSETLRQFSSTFGISVEELTSYLKTYTESLPSDDNAKVKIANSIWVNETYRFIPNDEFLARASDCFDAEVFATPFDSSTAKSINNWVKEKTDKTIPEIVDKVPEDAIMYLANALSFDAKWPTAYERDRVKDAVFTTESGDKIDCELMYSDEGTYISDENSCGFIKHFKNRGYAFAAILPNEGMTVKDYLETLDGEKLQGMLRDSHSATVYAAIPKFEVEYSAELSDTLSAMGIIDAFDPDKADFTKMGELTQAADGRLYISRVLHKTYIQVAEQGTKAGAATIAELLCGSAAPTEPVFVYLNRPFVYMIIDTEVNLPVFIGTIANLDI